MNYSGINDIFNNKRSTVIDKILLPEDSRADNHPDIQDVQGKHFPACQIRCIVYISSEQAHLLLPSLKFHCYGSDMISFRAFRVNSQNSNQ